MQGKFRVFPGETGNICNFFSPAGPPGAFQMRFSFFFIIEYYSKAAIGGIIVMITAPDRPVRRFPRSEEFPHMEMDWRQRRINGALFSILMVLVILVLVVGGVRYHQYRQAQQAPADESVQLSADSAHSYAALSYSNGSATLSFSVDGETDQWIWTDDPTFPLSDTTVEEICAMLTDLKPQQTLTPDKPLEDYNLDDPSVYISATRADGSVLRLDFGKTTSDGKSYYALMDSDPAQVYIFDGALVEKLSVAIYDMTQLPVLPALTDKTVLSCAVTGAVETAITAGKDGTWLCDGQDVTGNETVTSLFKQLELLTFTKCVDYRPSDEAASICGFDAPAAVVEVAYQSDTGAEQTMTLTIGNASVDGAGRYVRLGSEEAIYQLSAEAAAPMLSLAQNGLGA